MKLKVISAILLILAIIALILSFNIQLDNIKKGFGGQYTNDSADAGKMHRIMSVNNIAIDKESNIYVGDSFEKCIYLFSENGKLLGYFDVNSSNFTFEVQSDGLTLYTDIDFYSGETGGKTYIYKYRFRNKNDYLFDNAYPDYNDSSVINCSLSEYMKDNDLIYSKNFEIDGKTYQYSNQGVKITNNGKEKVQKLDTNEFALSENAVSTLLVYLAIILFIGSILCIGGVLSKNRVINPLTEE